jgi:serine/threonine-protein kinase ULK/ATG1
MVNGMREVCSNGMVHRDLKPSNILIHNHEVKIGDFGFSKLIEEGSELMTSVVGSPQYMSPQILEGVEYTSKTDVWSMGIVLYEMLYGKPPYEGGTA